MAIKWVIVEDPQVDMKVKLAEYDGMDEFFHNLVGQRAVIGTISGKKAWVKTKNAACFWPINALLTKEK